MKDAILAFGMGGPDDNASIEPFLKNLLSDTDIINFHVGKTLQKFIAGRIAKSRSAKVAPLYNLMGGGSPQLKHTQEMLAKLADVYKTNTSTELDTYVGMCYWHPFIEDTIEQIRKKKYRKLFLLPLYPQYSTTTTGAGMHRVNRALLKKPFEMPVITFSKFNTFKPYINVMVQNINEAVQKLGKKPQDVHLLFSAHSLPQYVVDAGDVYVDDLNKQIEEVVTLVNPHSHSLAYQSKLGRMKWLEPRVQDELINLHKNKVENIVLIAVSFINDHIETLVELDEEIIPQAARLGMNIVRSASFNNSDSFVQVMYELIAGNTE